MTDSTNETLRQAALFYHEFPKPGKLEVRATKPLANGRDLTRAYSPGVAEACLEIKADPTTAARYTTRANLVGVVTNGSAVLGLGNIGALASKPVMEGKAVLFKKFANIDCFDIELNESDPVKLAEIVCSLEPTFGAINLEDIKAPDCFIVEEICRKRMNIPVFHDDQHGTAIICLAGFINALKLTDRDVATTKVVVNGAGAAAIATIRLLHKYGVKKENIVMCDTHGVIYKGRRWMNVYKEEFATTRPERTLHDALVGADCFIGVSVGNALKKDDVALMAKKPIIFAMANPTPEISPADAKAVCPDAIVATGRSDFPNQVNNVMCFPFLFRGTLDVRSRDINAQMKMACALALAELARQPVPEEVSEAY